MLEIKPCTYEATKFAVLNWHYSHRMPAGKLFRLGVWEDGVFKGVVVYGRGANNHLASSLGFEQTECVELVRVALKTHTTPVSKIIAISNKLLKKYNQGLKLIVSYADLSQRNHVGTIYQASNWIYLGSRDTIKGSYYIVNGVVMHGRSVRSKWGSEKNIPYKWEYAPTYTKHMYVYPLEAEVREKFSKQAKPYPKK